MPRSRQIGRRPERFTVLVSAVVSCFVASGCGGEVASDSLGAGGSASTPDASAPGNAGNAGNAVNAGNSGAPGASTVSVCGAASPLAASPSWEGIGYDGYAFNPGYFGFSPDGLKLESPGRTRTVYETQTGAVLGTRGVTVVFRNREWTREVVGGQVLDMESQSVLLQLSTAGVSALSGDGRYFFWLEGSCVAGSLNVYRLSVDTHEQEALALSGFCDGGRLPTLSVTETGSAALAATGSGRLWRADFERASVSSIEVHPVLTNGNVGLSIAFSPDERFIAVLGADGRLRTFSYPDLGRGLVDVPAAFTYAFSWCYCRAMWFAPVAWSPDGSRLASADEMGNVVVRRACDGQALATLTSPGPLHPALSPRPGDLGPIYLAFAPNGAGLAVGFEGGLKYFALAEAGE